MSNNSVVNWPSNASRNEAIERPNRLGEACVSTSNQIVPPDNSQQAPSDHLRRPVQSMVSTGRSVEPNRKGTGEVASDKRINNQVDDEEKQLESRTRHDKDAVSEKKVVDDDAGLRSFTKFILTDMQKGEGTFTREQSIALLKWLFQTRGFEIHSKEFRSSVIGFRYHRALREIRNRWTEEPRKPLPQTSLVQRIRNDLKNCRKAFIQGPISHRGQKKAFNELLPDPANLVALFCLDRQGDVYNSVARELVFLPNPEYCLVPLAGHTPFSTDMPTQLGNALGLVTPATCKSLIRRELRRERIVTMDEVDTIKSDMVDKFSQHFNKYTAKTFSETITEEVMKKISEAEGSAIKNLTEENDALKKDIKKGKEESAKLESRIVEIEKQMNQPQQNATPSAPPALPTKKHRRKRLASEQPDSDAEQQSKKAKRLKRTKPGKANDTPEVERKVRAFCNKDIYD